MILISGANLKETQEEILPIDSEGFPYVCVCRKMNRQIEDAIPWHWHPYIEIAYVEEGEVDYHTPEKQIHLKKGEMIFLNSNVLHDVRIGEHTRNCHLYAMLFDMHFLSGIYNSVFEQNYMMPVLRCRKLDAYLIQPDCHRRIQMLNEILNTIEQSEQEGFGYEFEIRANLSRFWCLLLKETEEIRKESKGIGENEVNRIKVMMNYIHEHYGEKIGLSDIARPANISTRESIRCFQKNIGMSPMKYLNDYRIRMAAKRLIEEKESVMEIGENCGFSSNSYFSKVFRETFGCTPKEYRKR